MTRGCSATTRLNGCGVMGDIWLPGLPPAYTDYAHLLTLTTQYWPDHNDAVIMAAIPGNESGFDYRVINDTPQTGDYSVGLWQINYYDGLYASRVAQFGTPEDLIKSGPEGQVKAAHELWTEAGGFSPWAADIIGNKWQKWVGAGPVPGNPSLGGVIATGAGFNADSRQIDAATRTLAKGAQALFQLANVFGGKGKPGWRP